MHADPTAPVPRRLAIRFTITQHAPRQQDPDRWTYSVLPLSHSPDYHRAYRLIKFSTFVGDPERAGPPYICTLFADGNTSCTCKHGTCRPHSPTRCKHVEALIAAGMFEPPAMAELKRLQFIWASLVDQLEKGKACASGRGQRVAVVVAGNVFPATVVRRYKKLARVRLFDTGKIVSVPLANVAPEPEPPELAGPASAAAIAHTA
jgi:hypothetical protein